MISINIRYFKAIINKSGCDAETSDSTDGIGTISFWGV